MIRSDNHVHTSFSADAEEPMYEMLQMAVSLNFSSICFTDHMDYGFPEFEPGMLYLFDVPKYLNEIQEARHRFPMLEIRQGVELGLKPDVLEQCQELTASFPFDFVIGSTHLIDDMDPYYPIFWESSDEKAAIRRYYEVTLENTLLPFDYDVYGHLDYILRYTPTMKQLKQQCRRTDAYLEKQCHEFADIIDEILVQIIKQGRGIEVNTAGLKYGMGHTNPHEWILSRYHELGGEIITIGSDAHEKKHLGYRFDQIPGLLLSSGFRYYTEFTDRKAKMYPIGKS